MPAQTATSSNVDRSVTFNGWGVNEVKAKRAKDAPLLEPVSYHPRKLGDNDVEVHITHCGICAPDIHTATEGWGPLLKTPCIVGHEIIGTVEKTGSKVNRFKTGQRVAVGPVVSSCLNRRMDCKICEEKTDQYCSHVVYTYNSKYEDGEMAQGGYQERIRVDENYVFSVPENLKSEEAAPLLCAGVTVFAPLARHNVNGKKVGIIGVGGLGHLAIQFAHKMGAEVISISTSKNKEADAKKFGAKEHLVSSDKELFKKHENSFDVIMSTANGKGMDYDAYLSLLKVRGTFIALGVPEAKLEFMAGALVLKQISCTGSLVGSIQETQAMLEFASKHDVRPMIEILPMKQCNEGIKKVNENNVRYRVVLQN